MSENDETDATADEPDPVATPERAVGEILHSCHAITSDCDGGIVVGRLRDAGWDVVPATEDGALADRVKELEALADAQDEALKDMRKQRDHWQQHRQSDDEAQVIGECVKALDRFCQSTRSGTSGYTLTTSNMVGTVNYVSTSKVERILRYLADRYGVTWHTPPPPPPDVTQ